MDIGSSDEIRQDHSNAPKVEKLNFFQKLFGSLFRDNNPEAEKKRKLKSIAKNFSKTKYHNFYKPSLSEIQPAFAKLMYEIYKAVSQSQIYFKNTQNPGIFKHQIINYSLSDNQLALLDHFDEQKILEVAKKAPFSSIEQQLESELQTFTTEFEGERSARTDNLYKAFSVFKDFCEFDYFMLLKKFDSKIQEFQFNNPPRLEKLLDEYIIDDLQDFVTVAYAIADETIVWTDLFDMLKQTSNRELITAGSWKKIAAKMRNIQQSGAFEYMIQLISKNPDYHTNTREHFPSLVEPYLDKLQGDVHKTLNKISSQQNESKTNSICMQIFGTTSPSALNYYVSGFNAPLLKKDLDVLEFTEALNFLKAFTTSCVKKELHEFFDIVVIRGQWDASLSAPFSNSYQELLDIDGQITKFDESFSEEGSQGLKVKTLLPKTGHDQGASNIINRVVTDGNEQAKQFLISATQNIITIGKTIKQLIEDYSLKKPVLVMNWKELEKYFDEPLKDFSVKLYKKLYLFVQLMQHYLQ